MDSETAVQDGPTEELKPPTLWNMDFLRSESEWVISYAEDDRPLEYMVGAMLGCLYPDESAFSIGHRDLAMAAVHSFFEDAERAREMNVYESIRSGKILADAETNLRAFLESEYFHPELNGPELKALPYKEFLRTEYWSLVRAVIIKRSNGRCQICNLPGSIHVHHRSYEHHGCEHLHMEDLVALCAGCHRTFHATGNLHRG